MDKREEIRDAAPVTRESLEEASAIAGGCMEMDWAFLTAEESIEAEEGFLREKIRRAKEWQEEREQTAKHA